MHKTCCKSRYNIKHSCVTNSCNEENTKMSQYDSGCKNETIKSKYEDLNLFGSVLQFQVITIVYLGLGYIIKDLLKNCVTKPQQSSTCYSSRNFDMSFKGSLEACSCSNYYFNLLLTYLFLIQIITALLLWSDKKRAAKQKYRIWPITHWLIAFAGGIPTAWLLMNFLRFKICVPKHYYTAIFLTFVNILWPILYIMYNLNKKIR